MPKALITKRKEVFDMNKKLSIRLIMYEIRNIKGNWFTVFFGLVFPIIMTLIFSQTFMKDLTGEIREKSMTGLYINMSLIIPLSILLIGYAVTYSQELEKDMPLRMHLFGFKQSTMLMAKLIANFLFTTGALLFYTFINSFILDVQIPTLSSAICYVVTLYLLSAIFFILAHGIAGIFKKFGPTYATTMTLYMCSMMVCGLMGVPVDTFPKGLQVISYALPMTYIGQDFVDFWQGGSYNFAPMIQSFLFLGAVSGIILLLSLKKNSRKH